MPEPMGFYTDTTVCIGCKACEVACKEWNQLPAPTAACNTLSGDSYDNTRTARRHPLAPRQVHRAVHRRPQGRPLAPDERRVQALRPGGLPRGLPDRRDHPHRVRHRRHPVRCLQRLPRLHRGLPVRRHRHQPGSGTAQKCTLCYDRLQVRHGAGLLEGLPDPIDPVRDQSASCKGRAQKRVEQLHQPARCRAYLYGADEKMLGGLNSFYLLVDKPEVYGLPPDPKMPTRNLVSGSMFSVLGAILVGLIGIFNFRNRGASEREESAAMNTVPSSTYFSAAPDWGWLIVLYFFFGGLAGGSYFLAVADRSLWQSRKTVHSHGWVTTSRSHAWF